MAKMIPNLGSIRDKDITRGERRLGRVLEGLLEDDYTVWYDIPVGRKRRYPDFIILHPGRGLLFLEVKDWHLSTLKSITKVRAACKRTAIRWSRPASVPMRQSIDSVETRNWSRVTRATKAN